MARYLIPFLLLLSQLACVAPALQVADLALRGKSAFDFYRAIVTNPAEVLELTLRIQLHFKSRDPAMRYAGLSNRLAVSLGWFEQGWLALDFIELAPAACNNQPQGCFSVELKRLDFSQCLSLANHDEINTQYYLVMLNSERVSVGGLAHQVLEECRVSLPLLYGRNEIKYVSY